MRVARFGVAICGCLVNPHLACSIPRDRVIVLVQRFFLLDTDRLRPDRLWRLGEVFLQPFMALTVYFIADGFPYLHQGTSKVERIHDVAESELSQCLWEKVLWASGHLRRE